MNYTIKESEKYNLITIDEKKITSEFSATFKSLLLVQVKSNTNVICDVKNVDYVDSAGLSCFLIGDRLLGEIKQRFILCNVSEKTNNLIKLTKLDSILTIIPTVEEAKDFILFDEIEKSL